MIDTNEYTTEAMFFADPTKVIVKDGLDRVRRDMGDIKKLAESIKKYGQLQPIVVNKNMELIAGGRRLAACIFASTQAKVCYSDAISPLLMRELELEENLQRKALTPAEEVLAVEEIHKLKVSIHGDGSNKAISDGWRTKDTAEIMGRAQQSISDDLKLAEMIHMFPSLKDAKTKSEIRKAAKGLENLTNHIAAIESYEEIVMKSSDKFPCTILQKDFTEHAKEIPDNSIHLLLTDPPYGINIGDVSITAGGRTGGLSTTGVEYDDSPDYALKLLSVLATESYRFCTFNAHAYVFVAPTHFQTAVILFQNAGWDVRERPMIWIKNESGQNNYPSRWPSSAYEFILFARRVDSALVAEGKVDWIQVTPVTPSERTHQAEKPVPLLTELIRRTTYPGQTMYDPFCGSGASLEAALEMKLIPTVSDISEESYALTLSRLKKFKEKNQ